MPSNYRNENETLLSAQESGDQRIQQPAPDPNYTGRSGYSGTFLPGSPIDLPVLPRALQQDAAVLLDRQEANAYELKYYNFSIVMNARRKICFFTAVNIDGSKWVDIDRDSGQPRDVVIEADTWYQDPRIASNDQSNDSFYQSQRPRRVYDRGHMVRRQDPAWGSEQTAIKANSDTFHFTNCAPQESRFNQQTRYWAGIENYVLDNARAEQTKVTVFTGPVFQDDDPAFRSLLVPRQYWKIIARIDSGQLRATALLADQSELLTAVSEVGAESFDDTSTVREYQVAISEIERLTKLPFVQLRESDTFTQTGQQTQTTRHLLTSYEDLLL